MSLLSLFSTPATNLRRKNASRLVAHLAICDGCRAQLSEEDALQAAIDRMPQVADQFESSGVSSPSAAVNFPNRSTELSAPKVKEGWQPFAWVRAWMALRPGWSAAALCLSVQSLGRRQFRGFPSTLATAVAPP